MFGQNCVSLGKVFLMTEEKRLKREQIWHGDRYRDERLFVINLTLAKITIDEGT